MPDFLLHPRLPVYAPPHIDPLEHEENVNEMFADADAKLLRVVARCPSGHIAQAFEPGEDGAVHTDHQPCLGAWWWVESETADGR